MKRTISFIVFILMLFGCCTQIAYAAEIPMSEEDYLAAVTEIMKGYADNPEFAIQQLANIDTTLVVEPQYNAVPCAYTGTDRNNPTDYNFYVYCTSRGNASTGYTYYIMWSLTAYRTEYNPGPIDHLSIEWDTQYGSYRTATGDGEYSSVHSRTTGIVVFNVEDDELINGETASGSVRIDPLKSGTMPFGSKYVHSYNTLTPTGGSATVSFGNSASLAATGEVSLGLTYTYGFTVSFTSNTESWQRWTENTANILMIS